MSYYVFRINYDDDHSLICGELAEGRLRQGWGGPGLTADQSAEDFLAAAHSTWGADAGDQGILRRYRNFRIMLEMRPGDRIVIPKVDLAGTGAWWRSFAIAVCGEGGYRFSPIESADGGLDFGHIVPVQPVTSFSYSHNAHSLAVSAKFKAYRSPVNRVYDEGFAEAVEQLLQEHAADPESSRRADQTSMEALSATTAEARNAYLERILEQICSWQPRQLEKVIEELFRKNGYEKLGGNHYDGLGGDIDLIFGAFPSSSLAADIFELSDSTAMPEIRVQAKKKRGADPWDEEGIRQLTAMDGHQSAVNILISTAAEFSKKAEDEAAQQGVSLINGLEFALLLVKYGLDFYI